MEWVFHKNGQRYKKRPKLLKTLCQKVGIKEFGYHAIRHYGASLLDHKRAPLADIRDILGHSDIRTTQIYLQSLSESLKNTMKILDDGEILEGNFYEKKEEKFIKYEIQ